MLYRVIETALAPIREDVNQLLPGEPVSTGILVVDDQHRALLEMILQLEVAMSAGRGHEAIPSLFSSLKRYVDFHFGTEERLMRSFGYPLAESHAIQHRLMIEALGRAELRHTSGDSRMAVEVLDLMTEWRDHHIPSWDAPMGAFLNETGVA